MRKRAGEKRVRVERKAKSTSPVVTKPDEGNGSVGVLRDSLYRCTKTVHMYSCVQIVLFGMNLVTGSAPAKGAS